MGKSKEADRAVITIVSKAAEQGNFDMGPVVVLHQHDDASLVQTKTREGNYGHVFGPYATVRNALEDIARSNKVSGDDCYKVILKLIPVEGAMVAVSVEDLLGQLGIALDPDPLDVSVEGTSPIPPRVH